MSVAPVVERTMEAPGACAACPKRTERFDRLGLGTGSWDRLVVLAGNPNTGKSTVFNALTGLRQHTGNWPGKTIARAEGRFARAGVRYKVVDLPGTYSLLSISPDEAVAREALLFGRPDVTVVVCDATSLERNLNLVLQIRQVTGRVVVALNLMDEARAQGVRIDARGLARDLGVRVVPMAARRGEGIGDLLQAIAETAADIPAPLWPSNEGSKTFRAAVREVAAELRGFYPNLEHADWLAARLLEGDPVSHEAAASGSLGLIAGQDSAASGLAVPAAPPAGILDWQARLEQRRWELGTRIHDDHAVALCAEASRLAARNVSAPGTFGNGWRGKLDTVLTGTWTGLPVMGLVLAAVLWLTITGANVPSGLLSELLIGQGWPWLRGIAAAVHLPDWLAGVLVDGVYLTSAWVVSVMLPPMAIFFPLFTLLEDFGYLPRVAFNLDGLFHRAGGHGKQALTMAMGFGCNAAGVIAARIIESPRERLVAILTNNFAVCNGRWPTLFLIASVFLGSLAPPALAPAVAAGAVFGIALLGVLLTLGASWVLSKTILRGEPSAFSLELPPYRPPDFWRTLRTSILDRTIFVLWRAVVFAAPAGVVIWGLANFPSPDNSLAASLAAALDPAARMIGLTGVILLAYGIAIPANEIVIPSILMLTVLTTGVAIEGAAGAGVIFETGNGGALRRLLEAGGWTTMTAVCLMLFSLCHNPCSTTLYTIKKETGSWKWAAWAALIGLAPGVVLCAATAALWRALAG